MSTTAGEVVHMSWSLRVPVRITLSANNISSPVALRPLYLLVPRQGYLSAVAAQVWPHFQHVLANAPGQGSGKAWFDFKGLPLKWNLPTGVLYDLLAEPGRDLPWHLTVHFSNFPDALLSWNNGLPPQAQYYNALKEAAHICKGTDGSAAIMRMSGSAQDELWAAVERADADAYGRGLAATRVTPTERQGNPANLPVRLFLRRPQAGFEGVLTVWETTYCTSRPIPATSPSGQPKTLADALHSILPALFDAPTSSQPFSTAQQLSISSPHQQSQQHQSPPLQTSMLHQQTAVQPQQLAPAGPAQHDPGAAGPAHVHEVSRGNTVIPQDVSSAQEVSSAEALPLSTLGSTTSAVPSAGQVLGTAAQGACLSSSQAASDVSRFLPQFSSSNSGETSSTSAHQSQVQPHTMLPPSKLSVQDQAPQPSSAVQQLPTAEATSAHMHMPDMLSSQHFSIPSHTSGSYLVSQPTTDDPLGAMMSIASSTPAPTTIPAASRTAGHTSRPHPPPPSAAPRPPAPSPPAPTALPNSHTEQHPFLAAASGISPVTPASAVGSVSWMSAAATTPMSPSQTAMPAASTGSQHAQPDSTLAVATGAACGVGSQLSGTGVEASSKGTCRVLVSGICPPLHTPLAWLHNQLHAADLFLYIVVRLDL